MIVLNSFYQKLFVRGFIYVIQCPRFLFLGKISTVWQIPFDWILAGFMFREIYVWDVLYTSCPTSLPLSYKQSLS